MKLKKLLSIIYLTFICSFLTFADTGEGISDVGTLNSYPYILKRLVNNSFDYFQMGKDNWSFTNKDGIDFGQNPPDYTNALLWPEVWWQQFDYSQPPYPWGWRFRASSSFPDWPLFVETFGEDYCYLNPPPGLIIYRPSAELLWFLNAWAWRGSCYGLAVGSILAFTAETEFKARFPELGSFNDLYDVILNIEDHDKRKVINLLWTTQLSSATAEHNDDNWNKSPNETLAELKDLLATATNNDKVLQLVNQSGSGKGAHTVVPYLIIENYEANVDAIRIYDNKSTLADKIIKINKQGNGTWEYNDWGGQKGLFLSESLTYLIDPPTSKKTKKTGNQITSVYSETDDEILIANPNQPNEYIQYNPFDTTIVNTFAYGRPTIPITGGVYPPTGYRLYEGPYDIEVSSKGDSSSNIAVFNNNSIYRYYRNDSQNNELDSIKFIENGLSLQNGDAINKSVNIEIISELGNVYRTHRVLNTSLDQNESLSSIINEDNKMVLENTGAEKTYDLALVLQTTESKVLFEHQNITLFLNSTQMIIPNWDSLETVPVKILMDNDGDGVFEDSITVVNQPTDIKSQLNDIPTNYKLNQNYPNPFNPTTTISYSIPEVSNVTLKVYDVLGNEVTTLVNEEKATGYYSVQFNSKNLSSGIYFYTLQTGTYTATKKMILLK